MDLRERAWELRTKRDRQRIHQAAIASELGVTQATVSRFELYGVTLPRGLTPDDYQAALDRLVTATTATA